MFESVFSLQYSAEASRMRQASREMLQIVKKTGTEEQKRALAMAVKESSAEKDFLEEARSEWKTLPIAKSLTQLATEKQVRVEFFVFHCFPFSSIEEELSSATWYF